MLKITIIGWYGTETIGDRAILAGIIRILYSAYNDIEIKLGSILPFFSERTMMEDENFIKSCCGQRSLHLSLFDSSKPKELDDAILWCDCLTIGGGPLEDIPSMFMLEYAIKKAKKNRKRTLAVGCGIGPLYKRIYQQSMVHIINHTDVAVFRDMRSLTEYVKLGGKKKDCIASIDPAVFALLHYKQQHPKVQSKSDSVIVSVREFTSEYKMHKNINVGEINKKIYRYIRQLRDQTGKKILLVPMHYFGIGDDDRYFMNRFCFEPGTDGIAVQNYVLNMEETMKLFSEAGTCVGMRFHSVVFQTILNDGIIQIWNPERSELLSHR